MMIFPDTTIQIFSLDEATLEKGGRTIRIVFATSFLIGIQIVSSRLYPALGFAGKVLILSMARQVLFLIPLVLILPVFFGNTGVWLAFPTADFLGFCLSIIYLYKDRKQLI